MYSLLLKKCNDSDWLELNLTVNAFSQSTLAPPYSRSLDYSNLRFYNNFRDSTNIYIDAHTIQNITLETLMNLMQINIWNTTETANLCDILFLLMHLLKYQNPMEDPEIEIIGVFPAKSSIKKMIQDSFKKTYEQADTDDVIILEPADITVSSKKSQPIPKIKL